MKTIGIKIYVTIGKYTFFEIKIIILTILLIVIAEYKKRSKALITYRYGSFTDSFWLLGIFGYLVHRSYFIIKMYEQ